MKSVVINIVAISTFLITTTLSQVLIGRLAASNFTLPRIIVNILNADMTKRIFFLDADINSGEKEWFLLSQFLDRMCLLTFAGVIIFYHT